MQARTPALIASLSLLGLLAFLTVRDIARNGFTPLMFVALALLALLGIGVVGALTTPPEE